MSKFQERLKAREMRTEGYSINVIAKKLKVSKGSVSSWCSDLVLTFKQKERLRLKVLKAGHKGRLLGAQMNKDKKIKNIQKYRDLAKTEIKQLSNRDLLILGIGLYWGEGSKNQSGGFSFSNSDPVMILLMIKWLKDIVKINGSDITTRIMINESHQPRIAEVLKFWSNLLDLPSDCFYKTTFINSKSKKIYDNHDKYFGVLVIRVRKSSWLKYKILGQINAITSEVVKSKMPA